MQVMYKKSGIAKNVFRTTTNRSIDTYSDITRKPLVRFWYPGEHKSQTDYRPRLEPDHTPASVVPARYGRSANWTSVVRRGMGSVGCLIGRCTNRQRLNELECDIIKERNRME